MGDAEHKLIAPCPDCGVRVVTTATVYLHLDDCPHVDEAVLRERLQGAVEDFARIAELSKPRNGRTDGERVSALGEIYELATKWGQ